MRFGKVGRADRERYDRTSTSQAATGLESMKGERFLLFWFWEGHPFFSGVSVFFPRFFWRETVSIVTVRLLSC